MANYNYDFWSKEHEWKGGGMKDRALTNQAIDQSLAERRLLTDRTRAEQDRQLKRSIMNYNMGQAIVKDMDDLTIVGDSGAGGFDAILQQGSREMADYAAHLTNELQRTGDYATYSREMAALKAQVGDMKALKGDISKTLVDFNTMNEAGNLSDYVSADLRAAMQDMQSSSPSGSFQTVDGQQMWVGTTVTGKPYRISASEFKNLSNKLVPKQDVDGILNNAMRVQTTPQGNILGFDEPGRGIDGKPGMSAADYAQDALDDTIDSRGNENRHRMAGALLTDKFGYSEEEAKNLLAQGWDKAYGVLKQEWTDQARSQYGVNSAAVQKYKHNAQDQYEEHLAVRDNRKRIENNKRELPNLLRNNKNAVYQNPAAYFEAKDPEAFVSNAKDDLVAAGLTQVQPLTRETDTGTEVIGFQAYNPHSRIRKPQDFLFKGSAEDWKNGIFAANDLDPYQWQAEYENQTWNPRTQQRDLPGFRRRYSSRENRTNRIKY